MRIFWQKGYEGASMADLTSVMGINPSSLYRTFGDKEALFGKALNRFLAGPAAYLKNSLNEPSALEVVKTRLRDGSRMMTNPDHPWGCMTFQAATTCGDTALTVRETLIALRKDMEQALQNRFEQAKVDGDLPVSVNSAHLVSAVSTIMAGLSARAACGASEEELSASIEHFLQAWPAAAASAPAATPVLLAPGSTPQPRKKREKESVPEDDLFGFLGGE